MWGRQFLASVRSALERLLVAETQDEDRETLVLAVFALSSSISVSLSFHPSFCLGRKTLMSVVLATRFNFGLRLSCCLASKERPAAS